MSPMTTSSTSGLNREFGPDIPPAASQSVYLGSDPGRLIAVLPALLGFPPRESLLLVGLHRPEEATAARRQLGPLIRTDLEDPAGREAVETMLYNLLQERDPEVIVIVVAKDRELARHHGEMYCSMFLDAGMDVNGVYLMEEISTDTKWLELGSGDVGTIGDVKENEIADLRTIQRSQTMDSREEVDSWLDPEAPLSEMLDETRELPHGMQASAATIIGVMRRIQSIDAGEEPLRNALEDKDFLELVNILCADTYLHTVMVAGTCGSSAAVAREVLVAGVRSHSGPMRRRLMFILSLVLAANDEGTLAFHTLNRVLEELCMAGVCDDGSDDVSPQDRGKRMDVDTALMAEGAAEAHVTGHVKNLLNVVFSHSFEMLEAIRTDFDIAEELCVKSEEERRYVACHRDFMAFGVSSGFNVKPKSLEFPDDPSMGFLDDLPVEIWDSYRKQFQEVINHLDWERINSLLNAPSRRAAW